LSQNLLNVLANSANATKLTFRIPDPSMAHNSDPVTENDPDDDTETTTERHTFCRVEDHNVIVELMEQHFCAYSLILGYSAPKDIGIKVWVVKQMHQFCTLHDLLFCETFGLTYGRIGTGVDGGTCGTQC
jgi:hypothetical protein